MRRFEFQDGGSSKFWEVAVEAASLCIRFGRIGTAGQAQTKPFPELEKARAEAEKLIREKLKKGYVEVASAASPAPAPATPLPRIAVPDAPTAPGVAAATPAVARQLSPIPDIEIPAPRVRWSEAARRSVHPSPGGEGKPPRRDARKAWAVLAADLARVGPAWRAGLAIAPAELAGPLRAVLEPGEVPEVLDVAGEAARALVLRATDLRFSPLERPEATSLPTALAGDPKVADAIVEHWVAGRGPAFALQVLVATARLRRRLRQQGPAFELWLEAGEPRFRVSESRALWHALRRHLSAAPAAEREAARSLAAARFEAAGWREKAALAYTLADEPGWGNAAIDAFLAADARSVAEGRGARRPEPCLMACGADAERTRRLLGRLAIHGYPEADEYVWTLLHGLGVAAAPVLLEVATRSWGTPFVPPFLTPLSLLETPEVAAFLAARLDEKGVGEHAAALLRAAPHLGIPALAALLSPRARKEGSAASLLAALLRSQPRLADALLPGLPEEPRAAALALRARRAGPLPPEARAEQLPAAGRLEVGPAPDFWDAASLPRPLLAGRQACLSLEAVEQLGCLLRLSTLEAPHPGLAAVREACDADSLSDFAWELFQAWLLHGADPKQVWALHGLGLLGGDEAARRLAPLLRQWPAEGGHARAVAGLRVLAAIGSDVALLHLHGIAQRARHKGIQDEAGRLIERIASTRGLSPEELADRLVPDLGLDPDGSKLLDFGPRGFRVGFDEHLEPLVRDESGSVLRELPKPGRSDDAALAKAAAEAWKTLRGDARAVARGQLVRLELAMCEGRRWDLGVFRACLVEHPLLGHLARRLIWAAWDAAGALAATFRVCEEGSLAGPDDVALTLAAGARVGLPHRLELGEALVQRWAGVFGDYGLLQPFQQLGRELHTPGAEEIATRETRRLAGLRTDVGRLLGLEARGWRRGRPGNSGVIATFERELCGAHAELEFEPGWTVGALAPAERQTLGRLWLLRPASFGEASRIAFSELVRDARSLEIG